MYRSCLGRIEWPGRLGSFLKKAPTELALSAQTTPRNRRRPSGLWPLIPLPSSRHPVLMIVEISLHPNQELATRNQELNTMCLLPILPARRARSSRNPAFLPKVLVPSCSSGLVLQHDAISSSRIVMGHRWRPLSLDGEPAPLPGPNRHRPPLRRLHPNQTPRPPQPTHRKNPQKKRTPPAKRPPSRIVPSRASQDHQSSSEVWYTSTTKKGPSLFTI